jgi:hypothetical protein
MARYYCQANIKDDAMTVKEKQREQIKKLHDKFYKGKKSPVNAQIAKAIIGQKVVKGKLVPADQQDNPIPDVTAKHAALNSTRNELMMQCKEKGVKNYRVLNKQELTDCLASIDDKVKVAAIVVGAVQRWRSGWGKNKNAK